MFKHKYWRVARCLLITCSLVLVGAAANRAQATLVPGDQVSLVAIEGGIPNPKPGAAFPVELTVGPYSGSGQLFDVSQLVVFNGGGQCISCGWQLDLSNLFINENDLEPSGTLTGTLTSGVDFDVVVSGTSLTWTYQPQAPDLVTASGIIDAPTLVPEPTSIALFGTALLCLGLLRRRRHRLWGNQVLAG
jgi:hypothetical protein